MQFGSAVGEACLSFVLTNIDDTFVLVMFFAESKSSRNLTPIKIVVGQYIGFTVITGVSLIGYAAAVGLPSEPIGFLGLLPILLGVWKGLGVLFPEGIEEEEEPESQRIANAKTILKVVTITIMNGGDNIGTYIPLFSQVQGAEIAIYVVTYYILLGVLCLITFLIMKQKHLVHVAEKYASFIIPFLYIGLGIYITVKSECFPWTVHEIDGQLLGNPGKIVMGVVASFTLSFVMAGMVWIRMRKQNRPFIFGKTVPPAALDPTVADGKDIDPHQNAPTNIDVSDNTHTT
ncbi:hypothetical protein COCMIDRAFT_100405 [Bipolaris oryzae ATCC 44560]|uniref:Cadmium resistance transporter n=1 Tax=Bipolaris oryzae ATCC 44560 TaxID=930090 RepID=W6Z0V2_COCMI|nr:uncharacterized protein COCMIDRAFT_100405 [Bipolaris oryzae ATCC 44560]EUC43590.1 hypothetical protein COCMIDRAFT_100405 [Bipolaris oryzae ATCC 44560]